MASTLAGDGNPRASKQLQGKVSTAFATLGWTGQTNKAEILNACTAFCQRLIVIASDLSNKEATALAARLGGLARREDEDHYLVALSDAIDGWEHDWEEADPAGYEAYKGGRS